MFNVSNISMLAPIILYLTRRQKGAFCYAQNLWITLWITLFS